MDKPLLNNLTNFGDPNYQPLEEVLASLEGLVPPPPEVPPSAENDNDSESSSTILADYENSSSCLDGKILPEWFIFDEVQCHNYNNDIFEDWPEVRLRTHYMKNHMQGFPGHSATLSDDPSLKNGEILRLPLHDALQISDKHNCQLPSFALQCTLIQRLYEEMRLPISERKVEYRFLQHMLHEYFRPSEKQPFIASNTLLLKFNAGAQKIIHYPHQDVIQQYVRTYQHDANLCIQSRMFDCSIEGFAGPVLLEEFVASSIANESFAKNLTGLHDPTILCKIAADEFDANVYINPFYHLADRVVMPVFLPGTALQKGSKDRMHILKITGIDPQDKCVYREMRV